MHPPRVFLTPKSQSMTSSFLPGQKLRQAEKDLSTRSLRQREAGLKAGSGNLWGNFEWLAKETEKHLKLEEGQMEFTEPTASGSAGI